MKKAKVRYTHCNNAEVDGILFESVNDVKELRKELGRAENGVLTKFIKSGESHDRINHIVHGFQPLEKALAVMAITKGNTTNTKAIYNLGFASEAYLNSLTSLLVKGYTVFMNPSGGMCPVEGTLEVLETVDFVEFPKKATFYTKAGNKVINLENDWELENEAVKFMNSRFGKFSYIRDMKALSNDSFLKHFKKFASEGGEYVYVYTTGLDHEQMYEYSKLALQAGLSKFIFDFNSGKDENINKFINWLSQRADVELI